MFALLPEDAQEELYNALKAISSMSVNRRIKELQEQLSILTSDSLGSRWDILISILRSTLHKLKNKQLPLIRSRTLLTIHKRNVYNVIDLLSKYAVIKPIDDAFPCDNFYLVVPSGLTILTNEVEVWNEISRLKPLPELQTHALKVIHQLLKEIDALPKRSSGV